MPKKKNFLGGMQNYNAQTGEYEPALKGPNGESPSGFKSFKKQEDKDESFDTVNKKRMGKGLGYDPQDSKASRENHDKKINELNAKYGKGEISKEEWQDSIDLENDRYQNESRWYYEKVDNPYDKDVAEQQAQRRKEIGDNDFTSEDYVDDFYDRVSDLQKEINTSGIDDDEYDAEINKLKEELETKKDSMSEDDYNKAKEMLDRFSRPTDDDFDANDEDSIWNAFESGKITEEERNKMLSKRSGKIANESFDETNAKRMGKGKSKLPF